MLPLKLLRSLLFGEPIINHPSLLLSQSHPTHHHHDDIHTTNHAHHNETETTRTKSNTEKNTKSKTPLLLFLPTKELVTDTYRLATIARDLGMDLYPTPSLSHIIFSYPSPSCTSPSSSSYPLSWSSLSLSSTSLSWALPNDAVPLTFPSLTISSVSHLRSFVSLSKGLFKLVFITTNNKDTNEANSDSSSNWNCCSISLFSRLNGDRIDTMEAFSRALAGMGWTFFKTKKNPSTDSSQAPVWGRNSVYLFRKVDSNRVRARRRNGDGSGAAGECRIRELKLPTLDFRNAPLRILQYVVLMTDDIFYLA